MAEKWYPHIQSDEFEHPEEMSQGLVNILNDIRSSINRPMFFAVRHPNGDAVAPDSPYHDPLSLHRWGIDHTQSALAMRPVKNPKFLAKAVDFDIEVETYRDFLDIFLAIDSVGDVGGIGLYPDWNHPGFHVDVRSKRHPLHGARWVAYYDKHLKMQVYSHFTVAEMLRIARRGKIKNG